MKRWVVGGLEWWSLVGDVYKHMLWVFLVLFVDVSFSLVESGNRLVKVVYSCHDVGVC